MCCDPLARLEATLCRSLVHGAICNDIPLASHGHGPPIGGPGVYHGAENSGVIATLVLIGNMEKYACSTCDPGTMGTVRIFLHVSHSVEAAECTGPIKNDTNSCTGVPGVELRMESTCKETEEWSGPKGHNTHGPSETTGFGALHER